MLKRTVFALLLLMLLLAVTLPPKAALAVAVEPDPNPSGTPISIGTGDTLGTNNGTVTANNGTIDLNNGTVITNNSWIKYNQRTVETNNATVTYNSSGGKVTKNASGGVIVNNVHNGTVVENASGGIVWNNFDDFGVGTVETNYGTVYNTGEIMVLTPRMPVVEINGYGGVVYNDHGRVDENAGIVHNLGGAVFDNYATVHNYGYGAVGYDSHATTYQYWKVAIEGANADKVEATGLKRQFEANWALGGSDVTLTPEDGFYFSAPPTAANRTIVKDGESYIITIPAEFERPNPSETTITVSVTPATAIGFSGLTANGGDTETTTQLTLAFDPTFTTLTADDITVTGATKGALAGGGAGVYTLAVSDIAADNGTVNVSVQKHGYTFSPATKRVSVRKFTPPTVALASSGSTRFLPGGAAGDAVFTITTDSVDRPLSAANFASATLGKSPLDLGEPGGAAGADGKVTSGSVVVTVYPARLNLLPPGDHPLVVTLKGGAYEGMTVTGVITVAAPGMGGDAGADVPKAGDSAPLTPLIALALLCGAALTVRARRRKRTE